MGLCKMLLILASLVTFAGHGAIAGGFSVFPVEGRNFTIVNKPNEGFSAPCPEANPNYAAFFTDGVVKIQGNFGAANIGVCGPRELYPYAVLETVIIRYEIYGDMIVFSVPGRVRTALRLFKQNGEKIALHMEQNFQVSLFKDVGPARS